MDSTAALAATKYFHISQKLTVLFVSCLICRPASSSEAEPAAKRKEHLQSSSGPHASCSERGSCPDSAADVSRQQPSLALPGEQASAHLAELPDDSPSTRTCTHPSVEAHASEPGTGHREDAVASEKPLLDDAHEAVARSTPGSSMQAGRSDIDQPPNAGCETVQQIRGKGSTLKGQEQPKQSAGASKQQGIRAFFAKQDAQTRK